MTGYVYDRIFNAGIPCENVHSQARRMIMFSPEPNFWIHAVSSSLFLWTALVVFLPSESNPQLQFETDSRLMQRSTLSICAEARNRWLNTPFQCYEVAKTPRPRPNSKGKGTPKGKSKGKEKEADQTSRPTTVYDYLDGSIHDIALRTHFQRGYEEFRVSFRHVSIVPASHPFVLATSRFLRIHPV